MSAQTTESLPVMPDVRKAQLEARRIMAISKWPILLVMALLFGLYFVALAGGADGRIGVLLTGGMVFAVIFEKKIVRYGVGTNTPLVSTMGVLGSKAKDQRKKIITLAWIPALIVGWVAGTASNMKSGDSGLANAMVVMFCIIGPLAAYWWIQTQLWEFVFEAFLLTSVLVYLWLAHVETSSAQATYLLLITITLLMLVIGFSFFIRWRRWVRSLPMDVKAGEE
jgi:hypothetical protein